INTPAQGGGTTSFGYTGMEVMARAAGTLVYIDTNNDGDYLDVGDHNGTSIGEGQTVYVNGNVREGAKVVTSKPTQVFLMTGVINSSYENRSFQVFPTEGLVNDYIAPASTARAGGTYATVLYLFNPQSSAITVTVTTPSGATNYTIPAGQTLNPAPVLPTGGGARVTSTTTFAAVAGIGTREAAGSSLNYDWGYSLLPARVITDSLVVGWAPGSQNLSVATYDPVWVTATAPTTIFVDYDADPTTGANTDPNGSRYDTAISLTTALSQLRITDSTDRDMTGTRIYTVDGTPVAAAYGEDPASTTPVAFPGIDLGTTLFPACGALCIRKLATISVDVDGDGLADPGDTLRWSVEAANTDYYTLINPVLFDTLPAGVQYVPGSTTIVVNTDPPVGVADDIVPTAATLYPFDESGRQITANIPVGSVVTAFFETVVDVDFAGSDEVCNRAIVTSQRETILTPANGADTGCIPIDGLRITKVSNSGGNPVLPGDPLTYTVVVTNQSSSTLTNIAVTDPLPAGLTWVSTQVTRPADVTTTTTTSTTATVADNLETAGAYTGSTGTQAWTNNSWTETDSGGGGGAGSGLVQKVTDVVDRSISFLPIAQNGDAITRTAGNFGSATSVTLDVETRCASLESGDVVDLQVRPTAAAAWVTLESFLTCDSVGYVPHTYTLTSGTHYGTATSIRFIVTNSFSGGGGDQFFFDNVQFNATTTTTTTSTVRQVDTVAGAAPPSLVTLTDLLAGESATIVIATTVDDPYPATDEITNIATVRTGNQVAKATVVDCVRCFDYSDNPSSFNGSGGTDPARARATSARQIIADTFQNLGYNGSTGTDPWVGTSWVETEGGGVGPAAGLVQNVVDVSTRAIRVGSTTITTPAGTLFSRVIGDLSGFTTVDVGFDYRCGNLGVGDTIELQVRPNGSAAWVTKQTFTNCNNATIYSNSELTLASGEFGTATEIRLNVTDAFELNELFFFDDVQVRAVADSITVGPRLGTALDREVQGVGGLAPSPATPPAAPVGDDTASSDDEDGITVPSVDVNTMEIPIVVTDADGGVSYVNGWLDWSNDGTFDAGESIFDAGSFVSATGGLAVSGGAAQVPGPGTYTVTINVPNLETNGSGYAIGNTVYSRFRVATQLSGVSSPIGVSLDGEVEDYSTTLNTLPVTIAHFGSQRVGDDVAVQWRTAQEVDNLGFRLYAQEADGSLTPLHDDLVVSKSPTSIEAQEYELTVRTSADVLWLEDVSLDGVTERHGPYVVGESTGDPNPPAAID
ncbi:MAG: GEVED domain-containing protein, partial [Ilumatobacteraceae bacterium]